MIRQTELDHAEAAKKLSGLEDLNDLVRTAQSIAFAVSRAEKVKIDPKDMGQAVRNFTVVVERLRLGGAKHYALVPYTDDRTEK